MELNNSRPHEDLAAERAVLGAVLADNSVVSNVAEVVIPDDFASPAHGQIFAAMLAPNSAIIAPGEADPGPGAVVVGGGE